jgi:hypothetical protein
MESEPGAVATGYRRPVGPRCNSADRQVGVNVLNKKIETRRADMYEPHSGPSDLLNHFQHA